MGVTVPLSDGWRAARCGDNTTSPLPVPHASGDELFLPRKLL